MPKTLKYILFDLDETLYPSRSGLMAEMGKMMSQYMEERLGMSPAEVSSLRENYYRRYGTTMQGLRMHHGIDAEDYMAYVHDVPMEDYIGPDDELDRTRVTPQPIPKDVLEAERQKIERILKARQRQAKGKKKT